LQKQSARLVLTPLFGNGREGEAAFHHLQAKTV